MKTGYPVHTGDALPSNSPKIMDKAIFIRRSALLYSIDQPVSEAKRTGGQLYTLEDSRKHKSVFSAIPLKMRTTKDGGSQPTISYEGHELFTINKYGGDCPAKKKNKKHAGWFGTSLFSITSKMSCPSFSLPAGPTTTGNGTCTAANPGGGLRTQNDQKNYICDKCYSLKSTYTYPNVITCQKARLEWVRRLIRRDMTGGLLANELLEALVDYATRTTFHGVASGVERRLTTELGVWNQESRSIVVPVLLAGKVYSYPAPSSRLHGSPFLDTAEFLMASGVPNGAIAGYFRIHDSGDVNIGTIAETIAYIEAWTRIAEALPFVYFWMPTRTWFLKQLTDKLIDSSLRAPNFIVRASALNIGDEPPEIEGLPQGSTVIPKKGEDYMDQVFECPVYSSLHGNSCLHIDVGCRACWLAKATPVKYRFH